MDSNNQSYKVTIHVKDTPEYSRYHYHGLEEAEIRIEPLDATSSDKSAFAGVELIARDSISNNIIPSSVKYVNNAGNILNDPAAGGRAVNDGQSLRDTMPAKARNYLSRSENGFFKTFGDAVGANRALRLLFLAFS